MIEQLMKKILLIEDNNDIRENTCELLELEGYQVFLAADGSNGLSLAQEHLPDVIVCDIMMPLTDGYEVLQQLKGGSPTATIPFIFLTANAENREMEAGLKMGADGYIRKPFEPEELFAALDRCLGTCS